MLEVTSADLVNAHNKLAFTTFNKTNKICIPKTITEMSLQVAQLPCALWPLSFNFSDADCMANLLYLMILEVWRPLKEEKPSCCLCLFHLLRLEGL